MHDVPFDRQALFAIPMWTADLDATLPYLADMANEVDTHIDRTTPDGAHLAQQTQEDPFLFLNAGWRVLEKVMNEQYGRLASHHFRRSRTGEFHLRRWAIRMGNLTSAEQERLAAEAKHNHLPALFSSIFYLRVPDEIRGLEGGTRFWNPLANLMDLTESPTVDIPAQEGRLVIFPSYLDHAPVPLRWRTEGSTRIVVSTDLFYVSGRSGSSAVISTAPDLSTSERAKSKSGRHP